MKKNDQSAAVRKKLEDYSYILSHNIGKGYSSQVFKGRNDLTNEPVAIKVIDLKMIKGQVHKNLLASEIEVLKILKNSENIIDVYDIYNTKNNTYIITELCDGGDLANFISKKQIIPEAEAIELMTQILRGYENINNHGIIHRDLKPANIFLKNNQIKIADFGFAMKSTDGKKYSSYNVGSPVYMPPEALNENKYSFKSDIWALGVIFFQMLTGKTPWRAKTQKQLAKQLISIPIKKILPLSISSSSQNFLIKTLTIDINERMNPDEIKRFRFSMDKSISKFLYTSENTIFDSRNNNIKRPYDRHDTSLNKNSINTPTNLKRMPLFPANDELKSQNLSLPKTAATINKTEHFISNNEIQTISNDEPLTQKQINVYESTKDINSYDKKYLSKQLLSQIHFCRFLYKLIVRIREKLNQAQNEELQALKQYMTSIIFEKLSQVQNLKGVNSKYQSDYKHSQDYQKISQIIDQYQVKYRKDLHFNSLTKKSLTNFKEEATKIIISLYDKVSEQEDIGEWKQQIIVLDYLVTLRQLLGLLQNNDLQGFHSKSKIQTIVEGCPSKNITFEHLNAIKNKLKAIKII